VSKIAELHHLINYKHTKIGSDTGTGTENINGEKHGKGQKYLLARIAVVAGVQPRRLGPWQPANSADVARCCVETVMFRDLTFFFINSLRNSDSQNLFGEFLGFFLSFSQQCLICRPADSTVSEDAGIEPRNVATLALAVRRSNHSAGSHPQIRLDLIHKLEASCECSKMRIS
jgi:hypothetical protein